MNKLIFSIAVITSCFLVWIGKLLLYSPVILSNEPVILTIAPGSSFKQVKDDIRFNNSNLLYYAAVILGFDHKIQAGVYHIESTVTPWQLLLQLTQGKIASYKFTLVEGWNFEQVQQALDKDLHLQHKVKAISATKLAKLLAVNSTSIEGWLYPNTYYYNDNTTDLEIYQQALQQMQQELQSAWKGRAQNLPYKNAYQALIVASLIERETSYTSEYPQIAGVILKRLKKNMRLQIDAAVAYGLGKLGGSLTKNDLAIKTAYNLYKHYGLPPTPISMPYKSAIHAALHPVISNNLYYVLSPAGGHIFSKNYQQHLAAVKVLRAHEKNKD